MSVLESVIDEKNYRPFSVNELEHTRKNFRKKLHIGTTLIQHPDCHHVYLAKLNGKKEKEALETEYKNLGKCSVCWKLKKTPKRLREKAHDLVDWYRYDFGTDVNQPLLGFNHLSLERDFYTWLYTEFNPKKE